MNIYELARSKGVPGMTRLYNGYHKIIGSTGELADWFRNEGVHVAINLTDEGYTSTAITLQGKEVIKSFTGDHHGKLLHKTLTALLEDLPDDKKVRMK